MHKIVSLFGHGRSFSIALRVCTSSNFGLSVILLSKPRQIELILSYRFASKSSYINHITSLRGQESGVRSQGSGLCVSIQWQQGGGVHTDVFLNP